MNDTPGDHRRSADTIVDQQPAPETESAFEQGSGTRDPNNAGASAGPASYGFVARLIAVRSLVFVSVLALLVSLRWPNLAIYLELGVLCGIANMWLVMSVNERFMTGRIGRSRRSLERFLRLMIVGSLLALTMYRGPWWAVAIVFAGLYSPQILYAIELTRTPRTDV